MALCKRQFIPVTYRRKYSKYTIKIYIAIIKERPSAGPGVPWGAWRLGEVMTVCIIYVDDLTMIPSRDRVAGKQLKKVAQKKKS